MENTDPYNQPIKISDAIEMLKPKFYPNERPYDKKVKELNNLFLEDWRKDMLEPVAGENSTIQSGKVWDYFELYLNGVNYQNLTTQPIKRLSDEMRKHWMDFLDQDIEVLYSFGIFIVNHAWGELMRDVALYYAQEMYNKVYSQTEDPVEWIKKREENKELFTPTFIPFWDQKKFEDMKEKVMSITRNKIYPQV